MHAGTLQGDISTVSSPKIYESPEPWSGGDEPRRLVVEADARLHPITLRFGEPASEEAYRTFFWDTHRRYYRLGFILIMGFMLAFGAVEFVLFPQWDADLWAVRAVMLPPLVLLSPLLFVERFVPLMRRRVQPLLFAAGIWVLTCFADMGYQLIEGGYEKAIYFGGMAYLLTTLFLYIAVRLRVIYGATLGFGSFAFGMLAVSQVTSDLFILLSFGFIGLGTNIVGSLAAYAVERYLRLNWHGHQRLVLEQDKVERLLHNILPEEIANRLKESNEAIADGFESVTVLFADIVGFTPLSEELTPKELVTLLDTIFSEFDVLAEKYGVEKIKTIGDAYMVAAGIPQPRPDHAEAAASMGLEMREAIARISKTYQGDLQIRIGLHSGPVVAGVIGQRKFIYDLWGDTVNTASRMESHSMPGAIQLSDETRQLLADAEGATYRIESRGTVDIKGKGPMTTFWLQG